MRRVLAVTPRLSLLTTVFEDLGNSASFESAKYPPGVLVLEPADAFLARLHVVVDSLVPLLINLHAVVNKEEFLSPEYFQDLLDAKSSIARQLELVESPMRPASLRLLTSSSPDARQVLFPTESAEDDTASAPMRTSTTTTTRRPRRADVVLRRATSGAPNERTTPVYLLLDEALESVLTLLSELERLVRPAATRTDSLTNDDWRRALKLLQRAMHQARLATDPDRPLPVADWGRLTDLDAPSLAADALADDGVAKFLSSGNGQSFCWGDSVLPNKNDQAGLADVASLYGPPP
mmetsp:Transcript_17920/g.54811  ORF Transcript_17920/g.54811 Transcript_17920/m.54811 type:complete len:293 (-) Transcript_17920:227-1105(-)